MTRRPEDIRIALDTVLSGASHDPTLLNRVVNASKGDIPPVKKKLTLSMALVLILILLAGTAFAAAAIHSVTYFLTDRTALPIEIDPNLLMSNLTQENTSQWLNAAVQDAYWDGNDISISIRISPKDTAVPFALLPDIGLDGESFDTIWLTDAAFHSNQMPVEDWLNGRSAILMDHPGITFQAADETVDTWYMLDYFHVPEENAVVMMLQLPVNNMTKGAKAVIRLNSVKLYPGDPEDAAVARLIAQQPGETESALLTVLLPSLNDPFPIHEHSWTDATCVTPETCIICGRRGNWGEHDFQPGPGEKQKTCTICRYTLTSP
ncbi:MAG: hypothetical protein IJZ74_01350 [Clostridia bacterium]|nr:hypothetical protein [Clostridia bacterium]